MSVTTKLIEELVSNINGSFMMTEKVQISSPYQIYFSGVSVDGITVLDCRKKEQVERRRAVQVNRIKRANRVSQVNRVMRVNELVDNLHCLEVP